MGSWRVGQDWGTFTFTFKDVLKQLFLIIVLKVLAPLCIHRQEWTPEVELGKQIQQALQTWESRNQSYPAGQKLGGTSVWISHPRIMFFLPSTIISLFLSGHIWYLEGKCWRTTENTLARLWGAAVFRGGDENWYFQSWTLSLSMTFFRSFIFTQIISLLVLSVTESDVTMKWSRSVVSDSLWPCGL